MKILNSVEDLWQHCLYCPLCQSDTRPISVSVGPDGVFDLIHYEKKDHLLVLHGRLKIKKDNHLIDCVINCLDNSFKLNIINTSPQKISVDKATSPVLYFYIQSDCSKCDNAYTQSLDLEFNLLEKKIHNIGIERESIYLLNQKHRYHITASDEHRGLMLISTCFVNNGEVVDDNKPTFIPAVDFDFSDLDKVVDKIKLLLLFS